MTTTPAPMTPRTAPPPPRSVLRDPAFLRLWAGTTASGLATWALPFVLGLAVLHRELGAAGLGLVLAARTAGSSGPSPSVGYWPTVTPAGRSCSGRPSRRRSRPRSSPSASAAHSS